MLYLETCGVNFFIPKPDSDSEKIFSHDSDSENFRFAATDSNPNSENFYFLTPTPIPENSEILLSKRATSDTIVERLFSASKNTTSEKRTNLGSEKNQPKVILTKNLTLLKELFCENRRKRTISMSSTATASAADSISISTMPKQSKFDDEDNYSTLDDAEIFLDS